MQGRAVLYCGALAAVCQELVCATAVQYVSMSVAAAGAACIVRLAVWAVHQWWYIVM